MKLKLLLVFTFLWICCNKFSYAQYENVWVFGTGAGLDFRSGSAVPFTTSIIPYQNGSTTGIESNASVCDADGRFLFYTDGNTVWNRNYDTMYNGYPLVDSLYKKYSNPTYSTTQGALIVPMPGNPDKYFIFSISDFSVLQVAGRLYYSVVDMRLNNGLGGVETNRKNILLDSNLQEKMISVAGDRCNIWVLTCGRNSHFRAYEINSSGVNIQPVISSVGIGTYLGNGMITVSPNRKKIASVRGLYDPDQQRGDRLDSAAVALFDFDAISGVVSNPVPLFPYGALRPAPTKGQFYGPLDSTGYGVCFSPDSKKLYFNTFRTNKLYQFDLSSEDSATMAKSCIYLGGPVTYLRLGPDEKIYFTMPVTGNNSYIGRIGAPNLTGIACQYLDTAYLLNPGATGRGLPNVISVLKKDTSYITYDISECSQNTIKLSPSNTSGWGYRWDDGSYAADNSVNTSGAYWLQYHTAPCVFHVDTFDVNIWNFRAPVITVHGLDLSTTEIYDTYQWYINGILIKGATSRIYTVVENGLYTVAVSNNESGCSDTSAIYKVTNVPVNIPNINSTQQEIKTYPNPASDMLYITPPLSAVAAISGIDGRLMTARVYKGMINISSLSAGIYILRAYNGDGVLLTTKKFIKVK